MIYDLNIICLLAFLPGVALINIFMKKKLNIILSSLELILVGSIIWNYVLIVPSLLLGSFAPYILHYFLVFTFISVGIILVWLSLAVSRKLKLSIPSLTLLRAEFFPLLLLFFFIFLVTVYHPLYLEWDAVSIYLPSAKSIAVTGVLHNIYHVSDIFFAPGLEMIYAWIFFITKGSYFRLLPFMYFLLTSFTIYLLVRKISGKHGALIAIVAFSSMISTVRMLAVNSLYADMAFIFYSSVAILFVIKAIEEHKSFWCLLSGMACTLVILTRLELGLITLSLVLSLLVLSSNIKFRRIMFVTCASAVFNFLFIWDIADVTIRSMSDYFRYVFIRQSPIIILLLPLFYLSNFKKACGIGWKDICLFILPIMTVLLYTIRNIIFLGMLTPHWGSGISEAVLLSFTTISSPTRIDVNSFFIWHPLFLSIGLGVVYLVPVVIGILSAGYKGYKKDDRFIIPFIWFIVFIMMWSFFLKCTYEFSDFRRLYLFAPIFSILVAEGTVVFSKFLRIDGKKASYLFILFNTIAFIYVWTYYFDKHIKITYFPSPIIKNLFFLEFGIPNTIDVLFFALLFTIIFLFAYLCRRALIHRPRALGVVLLSILALSQIAFLNSILVPVVSYVNRQSGWDPNYYNQLVPESPMQLGGAANVFEVIDYYNSHITDNYVTVSFFAYYLRYYANRSIVDLCSLFGYQSLLTILKFDDSNMLLDKLFDSKIRYFLIPKPSHPVQIARETYERNLEHFLLFKEIKRNPSFILVKEFTYYWLYKLVSPEEYIKYYSYEYHPTVVSDDDQTIIYTTKTDNIILSDDSRIYVKGNDSLKIIVISVSAQAHQYFMHQFPEPQNLTQYDLISFYWYGQNSGVTIHARFYSNSWRNQFYFEFVDNWSGWSRFMIPRSKFKVLVGSPNWENITHFGFVFTSDITRKKTFYLDRVIFDGDWLKIEQNMFPLPPLSSQR